MSFSENLKAIRKKNQLSQEELAELLGVSRQAVSKWELGEGYPEVEKLLILSKKLNVSLDSLMTGSIPGNDVRETSRPGIIRIILITSMIGERIVNLLSVICYSRNRSMIIFYDEVPHAEIVPVIIITRKSVRVIGIGGRRKCD